MYKCQIIWLDAVDIQVLIKMKITAPFLAKKYILNSQKSIFILELFTNIFLISKSFQKWKQCQVKFHSYVQTYS